MQYALVNGECQEPQKGLSGMCEGCIYPVVAKCGKVKIWHWAHKRKHMCDPWWENETQWHRAWKEQFPKEWQEIIQHAENGEQHRADVKTDQGSVIEFQHSNIEPEERLSRENFYKKMIWIVNGLRRSMDKKKFIAVLNNHSVLLDAKMQVRRLLDYFDSSSLLRDWISSKVPVFFDFGEDILWGLLPKTVERKAYVFIIRRNELLSYLLPGSQTNFEALLKSLNDFIIKREMLAGVQQNFRSVAYTNYMLRRSNHKRL